MKNVISDSGKLNIARCGECNTIFTFEENDIESINLNCRNNKYVKCPNCDNNIASAMTIFTDSIFFGNLNK